MKKAPPRPVVSLPLATQFNEMIAMDLKFYEDVYFLVMVDLATRYCSACVIKDKRSSTIVKNVLIYWISRFGSMKRILVDNGREFDSEEFRNMGETFGITIMNTAAEAPFSNGVCERLNGVIGRSVAKIRLDSNCSVEEALAWSISARNSLSNHSGFSPNQLVFGFNPCLPNVMRDRLPALENSSFEIVRRNLNAMHAARKTAIEIESSERIRRALRHNVRPTDTSRINLGDKVFYKRNNEDCWHGPSIVIGKDGKQLFVRHGGSYVRVHSCRLQKAPINETGGTQANVTAAPSSQNQGQRAPVLPTIGEEDEISEEISCEDDINGEISEMSVNIPEQVVPVPDGEIERTNNAVQEQAPKLKIGVRFEGKDNASGETYTGKIVSRAGKATGKYRNCFNVQKDSDKSVIWVDFDSDISNVKQIPDAEEVLISYNSDAVMDAKRREIENWQRNDVYEEVDTHMVSVRPISVRWVVTEKLKNGANIVKARLVARGFEENTGEIPKDSPTCAKESVRTAIAISCAMGWDLNSIDVKSAYLQGNDINREIFLKPPKEFYEGNLWKLKKTVYGLNDAGRAWYLRIKEVLLKLGGQMSHLEPALFSWREPAEGFHGIICVYVDDLLWAGTNRFVNIINKVKSTFSIGSSEERTFRYIGLNINSNRAGVSVDQMGYINAIESLKLSAERKKQRKSPITQTEKDEYRKSIGQLNWISTQTRPDIAYDVCDLSVAMKTATVENLVQLNKVITRVKTEPYKLMFPKLNSLENCYLECYSDAAFANLPDEGSQGGFVIFLRSDKRCPIAWQSKKLKRVVNSTLAAETMALLEGAKSAAYIAELITGITGTPKMKIHGFTDCKSLFDNLKTYHKVEDKRTRIDMACLQDMIDKKELEVHWIDDKNQLANPLTKKGASTEKLVKSLTNGGH